MKPKILIFSPSDKLDNRSLPVSKDKMRLRKLLEKEYELGTRSVALSWNGTLSQKIVIETNPIGGVVYDQTIVDDFINEVDAKRNAAMAVSL